MGVRRLFPEEGQKHNICVKICFKTYYSIFFQKIRKANYFCRPRGASAPSCPPPHARELHWITFDMSLLLINLKKSKHSYLLHYYNNLISFSLLYMSTLIWVLRRCFLVVCCRRCSTGPTSCIVKLKRLQGRETSKRQFR